MLSPKRILIKVVDAHNGGLTCIAEMGSDIVTGGKDGCVSVWDGTLQRVRQWDMSKPPDPKKDTGFRGVNRVHSVAVQGESIIVSCVNSTIYRVSPKAGVESLVSSHFGDLSSSARYGELWALAPDPKGSRFATVCDDATLRVWDASTRKCVQKVDIGATQSGGAARALSWSPDGKWIVVGFLQGSFAVFDSITLEEELRVNKHKRRIQCIAFSPCSKFLAIGGADTTVDVFDVTADFRRAHLIKDNSATVLQIDWSADSKYIKTTSQMFELMHFDLSAGGAAVPREKAAELRDVKWATMTATLGWDVQGIWASRDFDGSEVNAVSRSGSAKYLVTADTYGRLKVFNYPCVGGGFDKGGHLVRRPRCHWVNPSPGATNVSWSADDQYVYSTGGVDLSIFQWKVVAA